MRYIGLFLILLLASCGNSDETQKQRFLIQGNEALQQRNYREAIRFFKEAILIDSCYTPAINNLGTVYFKQALYHKAEQQYNQALICDHQFLDAYMNRANAFYELNELYRALDDLEYVNKHIPDSATVHFRIGLAKAKLRKYDEAIDAFNRALDIEPDNVETIINRGTVKYYMNDLLAAESDLNKAVKMDETEANAYNALALIEVERKNYSKAMSLVNQALALEAGQPYFLNNRGFISLMLGNMEAAKSDIDRSITIDPNNAWAYRNKGWYYYEKGMYQDAVRLLERAVKLDPYMREGNLMLSQAYFEVGEKDKACIALKEAKENKSVIADSIAARCW